MAIPKGKLRSFSICLSDLPKDKMTKAVNSKIYINLNSWDNDETDQYDNDFSVTVNFTKEEREARTAQGLKNLYVGNGRVIATGQQAATPEDTDDLPF